MKRIWIINHYATPPMYGGLTRHHFLAKYVNSGKYDVLLIAASAIHNSNVNIIEKEEKIPFKNSFIDGVNYLHVKTCQYSSKFMRVVNMLQFYFRTYKICKKKIKNGEKPDYIYTSMPHPLSPLLSLRLAKKFNIPCTVEIRDLWPESMVSYGVMKKNNIIVSILYKLEKYIYKRADKLVFTMEGAKDYLKKLKYSDELNFNKIYNLNNGVDLKEYYSNLERFKTNDKDLESNKFKLIYTGSIRYIYNIKKLITVAENIKNKDIIFLIYGQGPFLEEYKKYCADNNIKNVKFKGFVQNKYIPYILSKADVCLLHGEMTDIMQYGMSTNKSFMYLAAGKPIVSTYPNKYDFIDNNCGITIKSNGIEEYVDSIMKIYNWDKKKYKTISNNALNLAENYDYRVLAVKFINILEK